MVYIYRVCWIIKAVQFYQNFSMGVNGAKISSFVTLYITLNIFICLRCKKWIINTRREDLLNRNPDDVRKAGGVLCAHHFEANQFMNPQSRNKLMPNALPTMFDVPNPPVKCQMKRKLPTRVPVENRHEPSGNSDCINMDRDCSG